ncbi:MAG: mycothiol system anti-sigma-R factor [Actinomycetota bacterium]|nr:mycothiol system anti-sigma-R factor [Actinomycetota bacterium]
MTAEDPTEPQDCADVLEALYLFIDDEIDVTNSRLIRQHLEACAPCLEKYDLEQIVRTLVARSCTEQAPVPLRERVLLSIHEVQVQISIEERGPGHAF